MRTMVTPFLILLSVISTVLGCGPLLPGQEKILRFAVNNFKLALPMVYTEHAASRAMHPTVSESTMQVQTFLLNLVMRAVSDVLEQQGRGAGLPDAVISSILDQLTVNITYEPLKCDTVSVLTAALNAHRMMDKQNCIVDSDMVSSICTHMNMNMCNAPPLLKEISPQHMRLSGTLKVGNIIMANWSEQMWQTVLNRVLRVLSSGSFATSFQTASINIV